MEAGVQFPIPPNSKGYTIMADKDQNDELMSEINSISKEMGKNFATMFTVAT